MKDEVLLARLHEDTGSAEEAAQLLPVLRILQEVKSPLPTAEDTARLAESIRRILGASRKNSISRRFHFAWLVLCSQLRVVQHEIWAASAIVMGLGMLVTLTYALVEYNGCDSTIRVGGTARSRGRDRFSIWANGGSGAGNRIDLAGFSAPDFNCQDGAGLWF